jgi:uncharacterized Fe-S center protein
LLRIAGRTGSLHRQWLQRLEVPRTQIGLGIAATVEFERPITVEEALEIIRAERARGHVSHAFFKDAMFGRFFAICNCCSCCCVAMEAQLAGSNRLAPSGYCARVDAARCKGCGKCAPMCPFEALTLVDDVCVVDEARCMGCGVCEAACAQEAMLLVRDASKGLPLEV